MRSNICDARKCSAKATTDFNLEIEDFGIMKLQLCEQCFDKFMESRNDLIILSAENKIARPLKSNTNPVFRVE